MNNTTKSFANQSNHGASGVAIWYLGQVGFLLQQRGLTLAIDPYLTDSIDRMDGAQGVWVRNYPPPFHPGTLRELDLVVCTHDHLDHTDPETLRALAEASPRCIFAGPLLTVEEIKKAGIPDDRLMVLNEGKNFEFRGLTVEPVAAAHEDYEIDAEGYHRFLGYLLHWGGLTLFHAGDTLATPRLAETLKRHRVDVGFLPINGRSEKRNHEGIVGNMNAPEAIELAAEAGFDLVVPTHYDLYTNNGAAIGDFASHWEQTAHERRPKFKAFSPGEKITYQKADRTRPLAVVVGAGKTGRGFLARLLDALPYELAFVDRDKNLVQCLNEDLGYTIHFFGGERPAFRIVGAPAALAGSDQAIEWMTQAAVIFTALGESNVGGLADDLLRVLDARKEKAAPKLRLLVCENGSSPAAPLRKTFAERGKEIEIGEAAIFCSTIELAQTRLDIQSESYDELPYDVERISDFAVFHGMKPVADFPILLKRKIYTYNCFSACIAYLGAYKKYQWYADAAGDPEIGELLAQIAEPLNRAICAAYQVDVAEQNEFAEAALRKFRDQNIRDDIARNARGVMRKLAPNDRLIAPARMIQEKGGRIDALALTMAAALLYRGPDETALADSLNAKPVGEVIAQLTGYASDTELNRQVAAYYGALRAPSGQTLIQILQADRA